MDCETYYYCMVREIDWSLGAIGKYLGDGTWECAMVGEDPSGNKYTGASIFDPKKQPSTGQITHILPEKPLPMFKVNHFFY